MQALRCLRNWSQRQRRQKSVRKPRPRSSAPRLQIQRRMDTTDIRDLLYPELRPSALGQRRPALSHLRQLHHGLSDLLLHDRGGCQRCDRQPRRALAQMGLLFQPELLLHSRRQRALVRQVALPAVDDSQTGFVDRPIWQLRLCGLRALHYLVPGGH